MHDIQKTFAGIYTYTGFANKSRFNLETSLAGPTMQMVNIFTSVMSLEFSLRSDGF